MVIWHLHSQFGAMHSAASTKLHLRATAAGKCIRLSALFISALRWVIRVPSLMRHSILFFICSTLPLHGIIMKQIVQYFHKLEHRLKHASPVNAIVTGNCTQRQLQLAPCWAAIFLEAGISNSTPCGVNDHCIEGLLQLWHRYQLRGDEYSVSWA